MFLKLVLKNKIRFLYLKKLITFILFEFRKQEYYPKLKKQMSKIKSKNDNKTIKFTEFNKDFESIRISDMSV